MRTPRLLWFRHNGKIVVAGDAGANDFGLARFNSNGSVDTTFSSDGVTTTDFGATEFVSSVALRSNGKIVVAGDTGNGSATGDFAIAQYNADGSLDTSFSPDGKVTTDFGGVVASSSSGLLRVTSSPALPAQILVDGVLRDSWGLTWLKLAPGSHTVSFTHVEGWTEPAPQTVTITAGATTVVAGTFTQRGSLRVLTSPAVPGTVSVDGTPRNDWGLWTDIPVGSHQVCFAAVQGFNPPACQNGVSVTAGNLTTVTGTYTVNAAAPGASGVGLLRVTTSPALPAQILVDGVLRDSWGLTWLKLAPGSHTVSFTHVEGWSEPAPQTVTITAGATTVVAGTFTQRGSLRVLTSPAGAGTVSLDGTPRNDWGMWTDVPAGSHEVCFGDLGVLTTPLCQTVTVTAGTLTTVTGTYT